MKSRLTPHLLALLLSVAFAVQLLAQSTAFTYQGRLMEDGQPANGIYELVFSLYDTPTGGQFLILLGSTNSYSITNGLFTAQLDFGQEVFTGQPLWLQIEAKSTSDTAWEQLSPRQLLTPTPHAIHALSVDASGLSGTIPTSNFAPGTVDNSVLADDSVDSLKILNGTILPADVNAASFNGTFWKADGNAGTTPGTHFVGTSDNQPLELHANGTRSLRIEPNSNGAPNMIGGAPVNFVDPNIIGATIAGGGAESGEFVFGPGPNNVSASFGSIGGGRLNTVAADHGSIGGGLLNTVQPQAYDSIIGGGVNNTVQSNAVQAVIGGGYQNTIQHDTRYATIDGGYGNIIKPTAWYASVGGGRANTIQTGANWAMIGGGDGNIIQDAEFGAIVGGLSNVVGAARSTIGGGANNAIRTNASSSTIGGGHLNTIHDNADNSTIAGGFGNSIQTDAYASTIGGGSDNTIGVNAYDSTIGGGFLNFILDNADWSTIGGGHLNFILDNASSSTIGGGVVNTIGTNSGGSTIGGGSDNAIQTDAYHATIPGGLENSCAGKYSFAAGRRAKANHDGSFVWADSRDFNFSSTVPNGFFVRGTGGVKFVTGIDGSGGETAGVRVVNGSSAWTTLSDRNSKENFEPVNPQAVLERLVAIPIQTWNWKAQKDGTRHIGPMAQDFQAAFNVGEDERHISTVDADGVALAAIQGLNEKLENRKSKSEDKIRGLEAELRARQNTIQSLEDRIGALERLVTEIVNKGEQP